MDAISSSLSFLGARDDERIMDALDWWLRLKPSQHNPHTQALLIRKGFGLDQPVPILNTADRALIRATEDAQVVASLTRWLDGMAPEEPHDHVLHPVWEQTGRDGLERLSDLGDTLPPMTRLLVDDAAVLLPRPSFKRIRAFVAAVRGLCATAPSGEGVRLGWSWANTVFEPVEGREPVPPEVTVHLGIALGIGAQYKNIGCALAKVAWSPPHRLHEPPILNPTGPVDASHQ